MQDNEQIFRKSWRNESFFFLFFFAERSKYYKKELAYIPCYDDEWLVDELRERTRPDKRNNLTLSDVLRRSEAFERGDGLLPVYTGSYRRPGQVQRDVLRNESREEIVEGILVALSLETYRERPLIGRVDQVGESTLTITWLHGHWTTPWSVCKQRQGQRYVEWQEEVPKASVVLFDFQLTSGGKLRKATKRELRRVYDLEEDE